jgi:subtilisin family serine protease
VVSTRAAFPVTSAVVVAAAALAVSAGATVTTPNAWQYAAIGENAIPSSVLHAARSIRVAVIDTGADLSAAGLAARHPSTFDIRTHTPDIRDADGHGTSVASLVAEASGGARLLLVKAGSSSGAFSDAVEAAAIRYAVDHGAKIVNISIGGPQTSSTERAAVGYAVAHGVLVVAPAGNGYGNGVEYPAALLGGVGLAVAASTRSGAHARFSNSGSWVSVAAPGERVRVGLPGGASGYASGTSFAAPLVAGAAALVWAADPSLTARGVVRILEQTASASRDWTPELGYGVIDVAAAVALAQARASARR